MSDRPEIDALIQAAKAAEVLIEGLQAEKKTIEDKIQSLSAVINARDVYCGGAISERSPSTKKDPVKLKSPSLDIKKRVPKGEIEWNINKVLSGNQGYDEHTLRQLINEKFSTNYQRSAVNTVLNRLKNIKYEKEGSIWKMIDPVKDISTNVNGDSKNEGLKSPSARS